MWSVIRLRPFSAIISAGRHIMKETISNTCRAATIRQGSSVSLYRMSSSAQPTESAHREQLSGEREAEGKDEL